MTRLITLLLLVILLIAFLILPKSPARAEPGLDEIFEAIPSNCNQNPDWYVLEPHPEEPGAYLYTYGNSVDQCSGQHMNHWASSDDGVLTIGVRVFVSIDDQMRERIVIHNLPEGWESWPQEIFILDGDEGSITIYPLAPPMS